MTESEARQKWCPFAHYSLTMKNGDTHMLGTRMVVEGKEDDVRIPGKGCIASDCMAWRWNPNETRQNDTEGGYCGLAGKP